jgi:hypothetical protein
MFEHSCTHRHTVCNVCTFRRTIQHNIITNVISRKCIDKLHRSMVRGYINCPIINMRASIPNTVRQEVLVNNQGEKTIVNVYEFYRKIEYRNILITPLILTINIIQTNNMSINLRVVTRDLATLKKNLPIMHNAKEAIIALIMGDVNAMQNLSVSDEFTFLLAHVLKSALCDKNSYAESFGESKEDSLIWVRWHVKTDCSDFAIFWKSTTIRMVVRWLDLCIKEMESGRSIYGMLRCNAVSVSAGP